MSLSSRVNRMSLSKKIEKKDSTPSPPISDEDSSQQDSFKTALDFVRDSSLYLKSSPYQEQQEDKEQLASFQQSPHAKRSISPKKRFDFQAQPISDQYKSNLNSQDQQKQDITDTIQRPNEEIKDPKILSTVAPYGKFSFITGASVNNKFNINLPPPLYLKYNQLKKTREVDLKEIMAGIIIPDNGGFQCIDKHVISKQKGLMGQVTKQFVKLMVTRQPMSGISLPTRVFQPRSQIQRIIDTFGLVPYFFKKASQTNIPLQ